MGFEAEAMARTSGAAHPPVLAHAQRPSLAELTEVRLHGTDLIRGD